MWADYCRDQPAMPSADVEATPPASPGTLLVDGWRAIAHSYALVNQMQCLELSRRPGVTLFHEDGPLLSSAWRRTEGLFPADQERTLDALPPRPIARPVRAAYRIRFPFDPTPHPAADRTFVFLTAEAPGQLSPIPTDLKVDLITPSDWSRQGILAAGAPADRVHVVPHGFDPAVFRPQPPAVRDAARTRHRLGGFVFLHVGAMTGNKGVRDLLRAFARLSAEDADVTLLLKGNDALYTSRELLGAALGELDKNDVVRVQQRTRYIGGTLSQADMAALYAAADCYVTPYRCEAFNLPALEAVACGLPLIATAGGPTDAFGDAHTLLPVRSTLVDAVLDQRPARVLMPDAGHLIERMRQVMTDPSAREQARRAGPAFVQERFTWERVVDRLLTVLELPRRPS